jgi:hypothetical protein
MSFVNPTPIQLGMTGTFSGAQYRVVGRVVMGVVEGGDIYYWNEFNLETQAGESVTLVYEKTEQGGEWRLFTLFEPEYPITAEDAASKHVGDLLNLDGADVRVTLVEQSRVYHIVGKAPEGVTVGAYANYFNAESDDRMDVVSWTGQEVECYHGVNLPWSDVAAAFNIRLPVFSSMLQSTESPSDSSGVAGKFITVLVAAIALFVGYSYLRPQWRPAALTVTKAPPSRLQVGSAGRLKDVEFRIESHALVEVAQAGRRFEHHEYSLANSGGEKALLVCGSRPGAKDWLLFTPLHPAEPLTPQQAGAVRWGQTLNVDGVVAKVSSLFQSTLRLVEGPEANSVTSGGVLYGFSGSGDRGQLLARWDASRIEFYQGQALPESEVLAGFKPSLR